MYNGEVKALSRTKCKTKVAIKSIADSVDNEEIKNFLYEIKIMGYIDPHLNLVSMVGSCTDELEKQIYVASVTLETANNKPTGEEAEKEILSDIEDEKKYCFGHCSCRIPKKMYAKFRRCGDCF